MFTCPDNDIHSVYLDGELPEELVSEYEAHLASCPECSAKLKKLKELKDLIHDDAESISFTQKQLDESFMRLQTKMKYSAFKEEERRENIFKFPKFKGLQYFAAGIAAAALISFVIPRGKNSSFMASQNSFSPVARSVSAAKGKPVKLEGNIDAVYLSSFLGADDSVTSVISVPAEINAVAVQKMILDDRAAYRENSVKPALADYDVFAPVDESAQNVYDSEHSKGFSFSVSSPFVKVSFQVGK